MRSKKVEGRMNKLYLFTLLCVVLTGCELQEHEIGAVASSQQHSTTAYINIVDAYSGELLDGEYLLIPYDGDTIHGVVSKQESAPITLQYGYLVQYFVTASEQNGQTYYPAVGQIVGGTGGGVDIAVQRQAEVDDITLAQYRPRITITNTSQLCLEELPNSIEMELSLEAFDSMWQYPFACIEYDTDEMLEVDIVGSDVSWFHPPRRMFGKHEGCWELGESLEYHTLMWDYDAQPDRNLHFRLVGSTRTYAPTHLTIIIGDRVPVLDGRDQLYGYPQPEDVNTYDVGAPDAEFTFDVVTCSSETEWLMNGGGR